MYDNVAMSSRLDPGDFVQRWAGRPISERAGSQSHFNDLCDMLGVPKPTDNPETDTDYCFEAQTDISAAGVYSTQIVDGVPIYQVKASSGKGFADVWMQDHFCWEYKRLDKCKTFEAALVQLKIYKDYLGNPPLLVVCDTNRFEIHTNFTGYPPTLYRFHIEEITSPSDEWKSKHPTISPLEVLRKVFGDPNWFKPAKTTAAITEDRATDIGQLAIALRDAGNDPHHVAHFLMQIVFCFFAEDIGLLPRNIFTDLIEKSIDDAANFPTKARKLFQAMEMGGSFGSDTIEWFNGGLFREVESDPIINIAPAWLGKLLMVARADWDTVEPSILGTLFERSLDPDKRSQIGAHYTSRDDIMLIVEPVVMQPLRQKWVNVQKDVGELLEQRDQKKTERTKKNVNTKIEKAILGFVDHLGSVRILDPACGSGNFLYVAIQQLLSLEHEVRAFAARSEIGVTFTSRVHPGQLHGIEINDYAAELARVSIWIGYLQWLHANADSTNRRPILDPLDTIECRDAILKWADAEGNAIPCYDEGAVCEGAADWPEVEFIIGNPPFAGRGEKRSLLTSCFGEAYVDAIINHYAPDLTMGCDLCCYWFAQAKKVIRNLMNVRVGLLATQGIRHGVNRQVLDQIKTHGDIFMAHSDRKWILDGANVHVSIIAFDNGSECTRFLNGKPVKNIHTDLSTGIDVSCNKQLAENSGLAFQGIIPMGPFDLPYEDVIKMARASSNPNGKPNTDVIRHWANGEELVNTRIPSFIIDFIQMPIEEAAKYEKPFEYVESYVLPARKESRTKTAEKTFWQHWRHRPTLRRAISNNCTDRFLCISRVGKHRIFTWVNATTLPSDATVAIVRDDDYMFGLLHSCAHYVWSVRIGSQLREQESGKRYSHTYTFNTFPFIWSPGTELTENEHYISINEAAKELNELRENWLNPPEWIEPIADAVERFEDFSDVPEEARELLRQSAIMARAAKDPKLKKRTLTKLYNDRPAWLKLAHKKLDEAVINAYAEIDPEGDWDPAWAEAYEPFGAGEIVIVEKGKKPDSPEVIKAKQKAIEQRKVVDEKILANLLRLNLARAAKQ